MGRPVVIALIKGVLLLGAVTLAITGLPPVLAASPNAPSVDAQVDLRTPVTLAELPELERSLGAKILQFHQRHQGLYSTVTSGGLVLRGDSLAKAGGRYERDQRAYFDARIAAMEALARELRGRQRQMLLRTIADLTSARASLNTIGVAIDRVVVRATPAAIDRMRQHPAVADVK